MFINLEWNLDEALQVRFEEGFEIGLAEVCEKIAIKMIRRGKSFDEIQEYTELPLERIRELAEKNLDA